MIIGSMIQMLLPPEEETCGSPENEQTVELPISKCPLSFNDLFKQCTKNVSLEATTASFPKPIYDGFKLPIEYVDPSRVFMVPNVVSSDLELVRSDSSYCICSGDFSPYVYSGGNDGCTHSEFATETATIYEHFVRPTNVFSGEMTREVQKRFTTDTDFLKDTQCIIEQTGEYVETVNQYMETDMANVVPDTSRLLEIWKDTKENAQFLHTYSYLEWPILEYLNDSPEFLQALSVVNILSPLFSLLVPFLFLIFPFVILRIKQVEITVQEYVHTLRDIAKNHFIGKALSSEFTLQGIAYLLFTFGLYALQTYQNVNSCIRYYDNLVKINRNLEYMKYHVRHTIMRMDTFFRIHSNKRSYRGFCKDISAHTGCLRGLLMKLEGITPFTLSCSKMTNIGYMLQCYYQLYSNSQYENSIRYSVGFGAYMDVLVGIYGKYREGHLGKATFNTENHTEFNDQYYPAHSFATSVKNKCNLGKNMIITGVNASGKTTYIKTTAINILLSQQFGVGFYSTASICPYTHIHSYLNIPDTSGRDSLFQAESRRCKTIIDAIESTKQNEEARHFLIFDELYSGTNPEEASKSAISLLRYLTTFDNVRFMLTTHYVKVCKKFRKSEKISNYKMKVHIDKNGAIQYCYRIQKGISKIQGGVEILKMMNYPEEILRDIQNTR
jgi:hypothetical protein